MNTETAICSGCGKPFERRAKRSNPRKYCSKEKCQKIKKIKNSVATFDNVPNHVTTYTADIQYYGRPNY